MSNRSKQGINMTRTRATAIGLIASMMAILLTGCVSESNSDRIDGIDPTAGSLAPSAPGGQEWGETADTSARNDEASGYSSVDGDGPDETGSFTWGQSSSEASAPAQLYGDGIHVNFHVSFGAVPRVVVDAYLATNPQGERRGPALTCVPSQQSVPGSFDMIHDPASFDCSASFEDADYNSGTYYGVIISSPTSASDESYGTKTTVVPAYTQRS